jgi:hypothetical protein
MIGEARWSRNYLFFIILVSSAILMLFAIVGPGEDYFRCYTWMVNEPERLRTVAVYPWTLNPPYLAVFMAPFVALPGRAGYIVFMAFSLAMIAISTKNLGGKLIPILLSAHMMWILWWGQIEAWGVLAFVLAWYALKNKIWPAMLLALVLASFKPQISFIPVLAMWWWSGKDRWKSMSGMVLLFLASLFVWGPWPVWYWQGIFGFVGNQHHGPWNASLGLWAVPLYLPALLLPMNREQRLIALTATTYICSPYMPYYSSILLFSFIIPGWTYLFAFLGYLPTLLGTRIAWNGIVLFPISILIWLYLPILKPRLSEFWVSHGSDWKIFNRTG